MPAPSNSSSEGRPRRRREQRQLDAGGNDRSEIEQLARLWRKPRRPREDGVAHRRGHAGFLAGQDFRDEEWVSCRRGMKALAAPPRPCCERLDRRWRQRAERNAPDRRGRQIAEEGSQRMRRRHFIFAPGDDEQRAHALGAPPEELEQVERRFVGPLHVLDDDQRGRPRMAQLLEEGPEDGVARRSLGEERGQLAAVQPRQFL
jgi:hypothetical protein